MLLNPSLQQDVISGCSILYWLQPESHSHVFFAPLIKALQQPILADVHAASFTVDLVIPVHCEKMPTRKKRKMAITAIMKTAWTAIALGI